MRRSLPRRARAVAVALLVMLGVLATSSPAWAGQSGGGGHRHSPSYLALGDSVPFGYRGGQLPATYADPANFTGYPELVGADRGLRVLNAACPGETTASFIDETAQSNGCEDSLTSETACRELNPLHVDYAPGPRDQSQLDHAVRTLKRTPDVRLVTIQIGANDTFICQQTIADRCTSQAELAAVAEQVRANLDTILNTVRTRGHYDGQIVVVSYYALDYSSPAAAATRLLDSRITEAAAANGATVASGYDAFQDRALVAGGSSTTAGLVLPNDVHPTAAGQRLLADAVEVLATRC